MFTENGRRIKHELINRGMTQAEFCRRYGIPQIYLSRILHSDRYPRVRKRIMEILGIENAA